MRAQAALSLLAAMSCVCCAAESLPREPATSEIKDMVNSIDAQLKTLNRSPVMLQTGTARDGDLPIYRGGSDVVRIDATTGDPSTDLQDTFYYSAADVVFVR